MTRTSLLLCVVASALLGTTPRSVASPERTEQVRKLAMPVIESRVTPGLMIAYLEDGERTYLPLGSTLYDAESPPNEHTIYEIGSITKVFTALLLADAEARGELREADSLASHLPEGVTFKELNPNVPIKLVHLADHASGLPRMPGNIRPANAADPYADYSADQLWEFLQSVEIPREPGEGYEYSNLAVGLLGTILALKADSTYEQLMLDRIAKPLGLTSTTMTLSDEQQARLAPGFRNEHPMHNWGFDALAGCGAIRSDIADLLTLAEATLASRTDNAAETDELKDAPESLRTALRSVQDVRFSAGDSAPDVALGWHLAGRTNRTLWHNGGTGGYSTFLAVNTLNKTAVVILSNGASQDITTLGFEIVRALGAPVPETDDAAGEPEPEGP